MPQALSAPFSPLTDEERRELLAMGWGITSASWSAFASERDDTLLVTADSGKYILKVSHPLDDLSRLGRQLQLMEHAAATPLPFAIQKVRPTVSGEQTAEISGRKAYLLDYLPGTPIRHNPLAREGVLALGRALCELQSALADVDIAYDTDHPWALTCLDVALSRLSVVEAAPLRSGCEAILTEALSTTLPRLATLPTQPTHNDAHTDNVLVAGQRVVGIVDWGDSVAQPRVADLAVAASYARGYHPIWLEGDPWQAAATLREGYLDAGGLDESNELFGELVLARLAQRIVLNLAVAATASDGGVYARRNMVENVRDLQDLFLSRPENVFPGLARNPLW